MLVVDLIFKVLFAPMSSEIASSLAVPPAQYEGTPINEITVVFQEEFKVEPGRWKAAVFSTKDVRRDFRRFLRRGKCSFGLFRGKNKNLELDRKDFKKLTYSYKEIFDFSVFDCQILMSIFR